MLASLDIMLLVLDFRSSGLQIGLGAPLNAKPTRQSYSQSILGSVGFYN
jgi:hypothetical protein